MRYLLFGANGQLGQELAKTLPGEVIALGRRDADLTSAFLPAFLDRYQPDVVVNCAAYNMVDRAEDRPSEAFSVNTWAVRSLAHWCGARDRMFVHFSTDYVFGLEVTRQVPYGENDAVGPINVYGQSKLCGEFWVRALCPRHLLIRSCGLYSTNVRGGKGTNFVETVLGLGEKGTPVRVVNDQVCTPTFVKDLAKATITLLDRNANGLFHWTNSGQCSWYDFAVAIFELARIPVSLEAISADDYGAKALRPRQSVLNCDGWIKFGLSRPRSWQDALTEYLECRSAAIAML